MQADNDHCYAIDIALSHPGVSQLYMFDRIIVYGINYEKIGEV